MQKYRSADVGHTPHRPRPDKEGGRPLGSTTPQPPGDPGKGLAHFPVPPTLNWLVDKSPTLSGGGGGGIGKSTMRCRREAHTTQTAQRWRAAGGGFHNSAAAGMCRRRRSWQGAPVHPSSALPCSPHIDPPGRQVGGRAPQQLQIMGSLPHGVSPGISLSLGDDWCGQVHREHWRLGRWREASPAYFSAQPLGPKLQTPVAQSSTGPPLLSLAL